jgi:undecaprenyl diphosphate synthase
MRSTSDPQRRGSFDAASDGLHVAIIMDGNGRWANARGLPRIAGHRTGAEAVRRAIEAAPSLGISVLTLYAFSADNWRRPPREVSALMKLLGHYLVQEGSRCVANGVRLEAIGRRDRLPAPLVALLEKTERKTAEGRRLH